MRDERWRPGCVFAALDRTVLEPRIRVSLPWLPYASVGSTLRLLGLCQPSVSPLSVEPNGDIFSLCAFQEIEPLAQADVADVHRLLARAVLVFPIGRWEDRRPGCLDQGRRGLELEEVAEVLGRLDDTALPAPKTGDRTSGFVLL